MSRIHQDPQRRKGRESERHQITREVDARALESAIWLALVQAERAGQADIAQTLYRLHSEAGEHRRRLESAPRHGDVQRARTAA